MEGGLGLRDPYTLNQVMGEKIWWRWRGGGGDLWKQNWTRKYNMPKRMKEILQYKDPPKGSTIWNLARQNRDLVAQHAFLEI